MQFQFAAEHEEKKEEKEGEEKREQMLSCHAKEHEAITIRRASNCYCCAGVCVCVSVPAEVLGQAQNCTIMQNEEARERERESTRVACERERERAR